MIVGKDICKPVPPYMKLLRKLATEHEPQFLSANIRILLTNVFAIFNDDLFDQHFRLVGRFFSCFVVSLLTDAKQFTECRYTTVRTTLSKQDIYCLAPCFFRMAMPNFFSATLTIVS